MIMLTRLSGSQFVLNSDLIERIDATPDTVITLTDGTKYVVADSMTDVVAKVRSYRSEIVALSVLVPADPGQSFPAPRLAPVAPLTGDPASDHVTALSPDHQEL